MQYRKDKYGNDISALGYGCMRFARSGATIDYEKAEKEVLAAYQAGVNYFDTAYVYGDSESIVGRIIEANGLRDKVRIATKLPQYLIKRESAIEKIFQEELKRLRTDYIDYYLMHMFTDFASWEKMKKLGIQSWIEDKKASGAIRQIGFSFHGNTGEFLKILGDYDWDFCQIQYNYMDEYSQAGREGLHAAAELGIPVIIMEPLRGGKLCDLLPHKALSEIRALAEKQRNKTEGKDGDSSAWHLRDLTPAALAFRWLYDQPEVTCVLSGMNSLAMVEENCRIANAALPGCLTEEEKTLIANVKIEVERSLQVPCTGCAYCMPCPQGVDIPQAFRCYNEMFTERKSTGRREYLQVVGLRKPVALTTQCVGCGKCEKHCPQAIPIIRELKNAGREWMPPHYRAAAFVARSFMGHGRK